MKKLEQEDISIIYNRLTGDSKKCFEAGKIEKSLALIKTAAFFAYSYNQFFVDISLEKLLSDIAEDICQIKTILSAKPNRYVIIDSEGRDNRGLIQQYLRALIANNCEFLYIYGAKNPMKKIPNILCEIGSYKKGCICFCGDFKYYAEKVSFIQEKIVDYAPCSVLLHLMPWDVATLSAIRCIRGVTKYNINLTDEAFWLGRTFFDYNIEFRDYGYTISLEKRGFCQEQLLYLPYYPIFPLSSAFMGFSEDINKSTIKILTGGSYYKFFDKNDTFFRLMDRLLDAIPLAIIVLVGSGNLNMISIMNEKLNSVKNKSRIYLIGNRKDINEVFRHCDIYLSSYPISGSLMSQYAAINALPILSYTDKYLCENNIEELICYNMERSVTINDINALIDYAKKLASDSNYRKTEGLSLQSSIMTENQFNEKFLKVLLHESHLLKKDSINYNYLAAIYIDIRQYYTHSVMLALIGAYHLNVFMSFKGFLLPILESIYRYCINRIKYITSMFINF